MPFIIVLINIRHYSIFNIKYSFKKQMNQPIIIPSLKPCRELTKLVDKLLFLGATNIVLVDDGSGAEYKPVFLELEKLEQVTLLTHQKNRGKGVALKTAFKYCLKTFSDIAGVITADADGQHMPEDIIKVGVALQENPNSLIWGARTFDENTPKESFIGNQQSNTAVRKWFNIQLPDTQTGLRGIPKKILPWVSRLRGAKYNYEFNMLIRAHQRNVPFKLVDIKSVYLNDNVGSHYKRKRDNARMVRMGIWCWFVRPLKRRP